MLVGQGGVDIGLCRLCDTSQETESALPRTCDGDGTIWMVVKIMVPFRVPSIIRHLVFRGPKRGP